MHACMHTRTHASTCGLKHDESSGTWPKVGAVLGAWLGGVVAGGGDGAVVGVGNGAQYGDAVGAIVGIVVGAGLLHTRHSPGGSTRAFAYA